MNLLESKKLETLEKAADESGVAVVVVDADSNEVAVVNNNSICSLLYSSAEFAPRCAAFCGKAFKAATDAGRPVDYECHAGLRCRAVPINAKGRPLVAIVGRAFVKSSNYRTATDKAINGEWKAFRPTEFFENILMAPSPETIADAAKAIAIISDPVQEDVLELDQPVQKKAAAAVSSPDAEITKLIENFHREANVAQSAAEPDETDNFEEVRAWRSIFGSLMNLDYRKAVIAVLNFLAERFGFETLFWFERHSDSLESVISKAAAEAKPIRIMVSDDFKRYNEAAAAGTSIAFRRRDAAVLGPKNTITLFPIAVGGDVRAAIGIGGNTVRPLIEARLARFCRSIGPEIEILRLRSLVSERDWLSKAVRRFNESLKQIDSADFWTRITQVSAELLNSERASLLVQSDESESLIAKAAFGSRIDLMAEGAVGNRVSRLVLEGGDPVLVSDVNDISIKAAPLEWNYKTPSFISYPIVIGQRRFGVLNFTDKVGGDIFDDRDLELLQAIGPQIAVALDRTVLKDKAGQFEQLSVTDALTGLLNRRYIEKRLAEEIQRSKRHRFPMSLMLLDVDEFKSYNDAFGHPAGDEALRMVANVLKEALRGADVAARYGGEEFAILLPQTTASEASVIAERIRQKIEETRFPKRKVTVSIGIAACSNQISTQDDLVTAADSALYAAKNRGRNKVQVFDDFGGTFSDNIH
ncbi:MAG: diguanylate cyclase [Acidobacteriota bacterium]